MPLLADRPLGTLRRPDCTAFVVALAAGPLAATTIHTVYAVLRSLMQSAVESQLIAAKPRFPANGVTPASSGGLAAWPLFLLAGAYLSATPGGISTS